MTKPPFLRPGLYPVLRIERCSKHYSQRRPGPGPGRLWYLVEFSVVKSEVAEHKPGQVVAWVFGEAFSLLAFVEAVTSSEARNVGPGMLDELFCDASPLVGTFVRCETRQCDTPSGRQFTHCKWVRLRERIDGGEGVEHV